MLCPICKKKKSVKQYRPFCSKRCADIDLHHWLGEHYSTPAFEPPDEWPENEDDDTSILH